MSPREQLSADSGRRVWRPVRLHRGFSCAVVERIVTVGPGGVSVGSVFTLVTRRYKVAWHEQTLPIISITSLIGECEHQRYHHLSMYLRLDANDSESTTEMVAVGT